MRRVVLSSVGLVVALTTLVAPAFAGKETEDIALKNAAQIKAMKAKQKEFCAEPRTNTPAKCNADFEETFKKMAETTGWIVMYNEVNDGSAVPLAEMLHAELVKSRNDAVTSITKLEQLYYPLQTTSQASAPPTTAQTKPKSPVARAKGKQ